MVLTPLEKEGLNVLKNRASRLIRLIELGTPNVIIANEVGLIIRIAAAVCGNEVLNGPCDSAAHFERWKLGFCMRNGCGAKLETDAELMEGYCQLHWGEEGERRRDLVSRRRRGNGSSNGVGASDSP
jgi:hypothetical protein